MKVDENGGNDHQLKQLFVFKKSPCQPLRKCIENSRENM